MITSEDHNLLWVSNFEGKEQTNDLATLLSSINVVSHEEIPGIPRNNIIRLVILILLAHFLEHVN